MKSSLRLLLLLSLLCAAPRLSADTIGLSIPDTSGVRGTAMILPVYVDSSLTGEEVISYQLEITYDREVLFVDSVLSTGTLTESMGSYTFGTSTPGKVVIAAAGTSPPNGTGVLIYIRFKLLVSRYTSVSFTDTLHNLFNEGGPRVTLRNGSIDVNEPPSIHITPDGALLAVGESHHFFVGGGTEPFQWSVTEPSIASIDSTGLLTAIMRGFTRVVAEDSAGLIDTTDGVIEIRALRLGIPDTSAFQGQTIDLPINATDVTGLNITSGALTLSYNGDLLSAIDVVQTGTLLLSYSKPTFDNSVTGQFDIAFAGSAPLTGAGVLLYVRTLASSDNTGGTYINFLDVLFNEDILSAVDAGYLGLIAFTTLTVTPTTATLIAGDSLQFSVTEGIEPYVWSVSDTTVAKMNSMGLLTAIQSGVVTVSVEDSIGSTGSSGDISVFDTRATIPDTTGLIGSNIDLPIFVGLLPAGQSVSAIEATVVYDTSIIQAEGIVTSGTLTEDWSFVHDIAGNKIMFASASSGSFNSAGTLVKVQFQILPDVSSGQRSFVNFQDLLFNEGKPLALTIDGGVTASEPNRPPVFIATLPDTAISENETLTLTYEGTDPDGDILTFGLVAAPAGATITATGQFSWTPSFTQAGDHTIIVSLSDGIVTVSATAAVTVVNVNRAPIAVQLLAPANNDTVNLAQPSHPLTFLWSKSSDMDVEDTLTYSIHVTGPGLDTTASGLEDSSVAMDIMRKLQVASTYWWTVDVSDGMVTVASPNTFVFHTSRQVIGIDDRSGDIPLEYLLEQNYPNPFNPITTINYDLPEQSQVLINIYDILGREIRTLVNTIQDAGYKSVIWDGTDELGGTVGTGIYLCHIKAGDFTQTRKMLLLR